LLERGGFSKVAVEQDEVTFEFDSLEHFTAYIRAISAPIRAMIEQHACVPRKRPGTRSRRPQQKPGGLEAAELLQPRAARFGNRLAPATHNSGGRPRRAGRTRRLVRDDIHAQTPQRATLSGVFLMRRGRVF
jgi:hypothetical protein